MTTKDLGTDGPDAGPAAGALVFHEPVSWFEWPTPELRWAVKPETTTERPVLQQKWAIGRDTRFAERTEWRDVPVADRQPALAGVAPTGEAE